MFSLPQPQMASWEPYVHYAGVFDADECARIRALPCEMQSAKIGQEALVPEVRRSKTGWVEWSKDTDWLFQKLGVVCQSAQANWYPFALSGFVEPLQLTHYAAHDAGHYGMHRDMGNASMSTRKLSLVAMLSDPADYDGGSLEVLGQNGDDKAVKECAQGTVIAFPAWEMHRVMPVTRGERWSLVAWVHGPRFI